MLFQLRPGKKRVGLGYMHSAKGTSYFKSASPENQQRFAKYDRDRSRKNMVKKGLFN